jgi:hypothetical protein
MAEITLTEIETMLTNIDAAISGVISGGVSTMKSYKIGDVTFNAKDGVTGLISLRAVYQRLLEKYAVEYIDSVEEEITDEGEDVSDLVGETKWGS